MLKKGDIAIHTNNALLRNTDILIDEDQVPEKEFIKCSFRLNGILLNNMLLFSKYLIKKDSWKCVIKKTM